TESHLAAGPAGPAVHRSRVSRLALRYAAHRCSEVTGEAVHVEQSAVTAPHREFRTQCGQRLRVVTQFDCTGDEGLVAVDVHRMHAEMVVEAAGDARCERVAGT